MNKLSNAIRYFIYARKSSESEDRQMASIESQIKELKLLAKQQNLTVIRIFSESKSAKEPGGREVYADMINRIKKGEADGIICWKLNRLARNPVDGGDISWMLQKGIIKHIQTQGRGYLPTDNVLVMAVELGMANQFIRDLSTDTKRGLKSKAERGWYPTLSPLGYMHNPLKSKGEKEIIKDPERFELVKRMFQLMLTGNYTPPRVLAIATNDWGLRTKKGNRTSVSNIYRMLQDPFYYGMFEYPKESGNWYKGKHVPMISKKEYDRIQSLLRKKGKPRTCHTDFSFTGIIRCGECGALITAENKTKHQKNGNIHHYTYYHCTKRKDVRCSQQSVQVGNLEEQICSFLENISISKDFKDWAMSVLRKENEKRFASNKDVLISLQKEYDQCIRKIDKLIDMHANDELDADDYSRKMTSLRTEKAHIQSMLNESDRQIDNWIFEADELFTFAQLAKFKFLNGTSQDKRAILSALGSNLLLNDKKLSISLKNHILFMQELSVESNRIESTFEPLKNGSDKKKTAPSYGQFPNLLRE